MAPEDLRIPQPSDKNNGGATVHVYVQTREGALDRNGIGYEANKDEDAVILSWEKIGWPFFLGPLDRRQPVSQQHLPEEQEVGVFVFHHFPLLFLFIILWDWIFQYTSKIGNGCLGCRAGQCFWTHTEVEGGMTLVSDPPIGTNIIADRCKWDVDLILRYKFDDWQIHLKDIDHQYILFYLKILLGS